ncbi:MAG: hypothetical protein ACJAS1_004461 [Oleiphilaceae bacterium]|jgi:hypothetical protein
MNLLVMTDRILLIKDSVLFIKDNRHDYELRTNHSFRAT